MQQTTSTTEPRQDSIVGGPDRLELLLAVMDPKLPDGSRRTVPFSLDSGETVDIAINQVGLEDGSGTSFLIEGFVPGTAPSSSTVAPGPNPPVVKGWYTTRRNKGWLKRGVIR